MRVSMTSELCQLPPRSTSWALETSYGPEATEVDVGGHEGRLYALGPEVAADDVDGRNPAVVVWADGEILYLVASHLLPAARLSRVANSLYP